MEWRLSFPPVGSMRSKTVSYCFLYLGDLVLFCAVAMGRGDEMARVGLVKPLFVFGKEELYFG